METTDDVATASVDEENPPTGSSSFPDLSVLPRLAEFASETTTNEIRTCVEFATRGTVAAGQSSALFAINALKQVLRSPSMQSLLARQSSFQSTPRSTFANEYATSNCQGSSLYAVDPAGKSHEFSNSSWMMIPKENDHSPSTNWEDTNANATVKAVNPSLPDTKSPFDMQTLLASLENLPENVKHQVMYQIYMFGDSRNRSNVLNDISEGWSSVCAGGTELERTVASTLAVYSASNNENIMDVANGRESGNQSGNDSDSEGKNELSTSKQLTPFQLKVNAPDGGCIHLPPSNTSRHVHSLHSSELQNILSRDEMHVRFSNWHLSNNTKPQYIEEKSDLTIANKRRSLLFSETELQRMSLGEPLHACPVCKITFGYPNVLKVHAKLRHNETHPFPCTVCEQKFDRYLALIQHMYSHGVSPTYKCEICGETFNYQSKLIRHNRVFHYKIFGLAPPPSSMAFSAFRAADKCSALEKWTDDKTHSYSAVLSSRTEEPSTSITPEHFREEQLFPCVFCGKKFSKKELLSQHMKSHEFRTTYECEICGQTFSFQSSLAKHRSVHSDAGRRHACSMCDRTFSDPNNLRRHQVTHLNSTDVKLQTKKTSCAVKSCRSNAFAAKKRREDYSRHDLQTEFSCPFCDKSFSKKIYLSEHILSHEWTPPAVSDWLK